MTRVDLVKEMKDDLLGLPEEVSYGIASGNKRLLDEEREDEKLEMEHFKRISYTRKETKEREKRRRNLNKSDYTGLTNGFKDFKRIEEFMSKNYSDNEDDEMKKYLDKEKFLEEHRYKKRDKKFKQKEDNRSEENGRQSFGFKKRNAKGKKFNKKW